MFLFDVNVLIRAARLDMQEHPRYSAWLESRINSDEAYGLSELVLSSFVRIVTNRRAFREPSSLEEALDFVEKVREPRHCVIVSPGPRHWPLFTDLCRRVNARGNLIADAYLAALAIESGCEWITADRDFARFPGLRWRHPLDE